MNLNTHSFIWLAVSNNSSAGWYFIQRGQFFQKTTLHQPFIQNYKNHLFIRFEMLKLCKMANISHFSFLQMETLPSYINLEIEHAAEPLQHKIVFYCRNEVKWHVKCSQTVICWWGNDITWCNCAFFLWSGGLADLEFSIIHCYWSKCMYCQNCYWLLLSLERMF